MGSNDEKIQREREKANGLPAVAVALTRCWFLSHPTSPVRQPFVIVDKEGQAVGPVQDNDAVVLFNYRSDRMVEISKAFEYEDFKAFDRVRFPKGLKFAGMLQVSQPSLTTLSHHSLSPSLSLSGPAFSI